MDYLNCAAVVAHSVRRHAQSAIFCNDKIMNCDKNLVDPASSHMLVSKVKPCMCVYNFLYDATVNSSIIQMSILHTCNSTWIRMVILKLIHDSELNVCEWLCLPALRLQGFPLNE